MNCRDCPYVKEEFNNKMDWYQEHNSMINDADDVELQCWCEKTGGKIFWYGQCSDAYDDEVVQKNHSKKKRKNKRERDRKHREHLKRLYETIGEWHPSPVIYTDEIWIKGQGYVENPKPYYKRLYRGRGGGCSSQHKKLSNRRIRRYKGEIPNGFWCHKLYDYWWEMY